MTQVLCQDSRGSRGCRSPWSIPEGLRHKRAPPQLLLPPNELLFLPVSSVETSGGEQGRHQGLTSGLKPKGSQRDQEILEARRALGEKGPESPSSSSLCHRVGLDGL